MVRTPGYGTGAGMEFADREEVEAINGAGRTIMVCAVYCTRAQSSSVEASNPSTTEEVPGVSPAHPRVTTHLLTCQWRNLGAARRWMPCCRAARGTLAAEAAAPRAACLFAPAWGCMLRTCFPSKRAAITNYPVP